MKMLKKMDREEIIKAVLGSDGRVRGIGDAYGIDIVKYAWVDSYLRDKAIRGQITQLREQIPKLENQPIHRDELKASFIESLKEINKLMLQRVSNHLVMAQARKEGLLNVNTVMGLKLVYPLNLVPDEIDAIFSCLLEGVRQADIDKSVEEVRAQIGALQRKIDEELSPQHRWIHYDSGSPMHYPGGCRWTAFVEDWQRVVSRFDGKVNIEGFEISTDAEQTAFFALGLDKVRKFTPLRSPKVKPPPPKSASELYNESVTIRYPGSE
jgi:hypothetical protein